MWVKEFEGPCRVAETRRERKKGLMIATYHPQSQKRGERNNIGDIELDEGYGCPSAHGIGIANALTQMLIRRIIREPSELVLDSFRERRIGNDGVLRFLVRKVGVEIGHIQNGFLKLHKNWISGM
jgi:hypothetical protein